MSCFQNVFKEKQVYISVNPKLKLLHDICVFFSNIHALNQSKEFKESFAKYKNYYAELMMMDNLSSDDDGQHKKKDDDDDMSIMDFYT